MILHAWRCTSCRRLMLLTDEEVSGILQALQLADRTTECCSAFEDHRGRKVICAGQIMPFAQWSAERDETKVVKPESVEQYQELTGHMIRCTVCKRFYVPGEGHLCD